MPYEPTEWKNREVEKPRTFTIQNNADGTITLIPAEGQVTEPGTPIMAEALNNIEQGILTLESELENAKTSQLSHARDRMHVHWLGSVTGSSSFTVSYSNISTLTDGTGIAFKVLTVVSSVNSFSLNINNSGAKRLTNPDGTDVTNFKANGIYHFRFNSTTNTFVLQGGGSELTNIENDAITIYVSNAGSDNYDGRTVSTPVKTIAKAVQLVKSLGAKKRVIQLTGGHVFDENIRLEDIHGSMLEINGTYGNSATVKSFQIQGCSARISVLHVDIMVKGAITSLSSYGAWVDGCNYVSFYNGVWTGVPFGTKFLNSTGKVSSMTFNNLVGDAVEVTNGSFVFVESCKGTNPATTSGAYTAVSGIIIGVQGTITATRMQYKGSGGQIFF